MSTKVKSFWATRGESVEVIVDGKRISRDIKVGMTIESDSGERSEELHMAAIRALNVAFEKEREVWLNEELMKQEVERLKAIQPEFDEDGTPIAHTMKDKKQPKENGK